MSEFTGDKDAFQRRIKRLYSVWKDTSEDNVLSKADAIVVALGTDEDPYSKSTCFQAWLFGYELPDMVMVLCREKIVFLSSKKKIDFIRQFESDAKSSDDLMPPLKLLVRDKSDKDKANFEEIISELKESAEGKTIGVYTKDKSSGEFIDGWRHAIGSQFEKVDISAPMAVIMSPKDDDELAIIKKACQTTTDLFNKFVKEELMDLIDKEKRVKHSKLATQIEEALQNKKYISGVDLSKLDTCYLPIIQSGGKYALKFSTESNDDLLHFGAIICMLGTRYKSYCSNIVRTMLVGPTDQMQKNYDTLLKVFEAILDKLRPGEKLSDVYEAAVEAAKADDASLVDKMTKSVGFAMGIEFRESTLLISAKSDCRVEKGMVFNINVGFSDLENPDAKDSESKKYALFIGDTVIVTDGPATVLTPNIRKKTKQISIFLKDDDDDEDEEDAKPEVKSEEPEMTGRSKRSAILNNRTRTEMTAEEKRQEHQKELSEKLHREAKERLSGHKEKKDEKKDRKICNSYKNNTQVPKEPELPALKMYVDKKYETLIMPLYGIPCPFHIATIKNVSQSLEGEYTYLRVNFFHPGATLGRNEGIMFVVSDQMFMKEASFRSSNKKEAGEISAPSSNLVISHRLIKDAQKKYKNREQEEREKEGITKQDTLIINPNRGNPKLKDLYIRPNIVSKRITGTLEAHTNGFRFTSVRGDKVDVLYNNIKNAFFQPCDGEMIILLHFHLKSAILFGKKKHIDVQFYTEVGEMAADLGKHQFMHDRDDMRAEQAERELRHKLKSAFKSFCEKVESITKQEVEFDTPFRDLGFQGAPNRSTVLIQPTSNCVVNLTEWPPFVITLDEVELVHFERVQFHLKNFDMVFVFKDYHRKTSMITAIPMSQLDHVKDWLNSCDLRYTEGIQSLNWTKIMKTITENPEKFFDEGGWSFLDPQSSDDDADDDEDEEDDAYVPSGDDDEEESSEEDTDDSNWSAEEESEDDGGSEDELGSSEEEGKDWDELEEEAKRADMEEEMPDTDRRKGKPKPSTKSFSGSSPSKSKSHHKGSPHKSGSSRHKSDKGGGSSSHHKSSSSHKSPSSSHKSSSHHRRSPGRSERREEKSSSKKRHHSGSSDRQHKKRK